MDSAEPTSPQRRCSQWATPLLTLVCAALATAPPVRGTEPGDTPPAAGREADAQAAPDLDPVIARKPLDDVLGGATISGSAVAAAPSEQTVQRLDAARALLSEQRYTEAVSQLEKALRYDPNHALTYRLLGIAARRSGSAGRALTHLDKCIGLDPADIAARYHRARLLEESGRADDALREWTDAWRCEERAGDELYRALVAWELAGRLRGQGYLSAALTLYERVARAREGWPNDDLDDADKLELIALSAATVRVQMAQLYERLDRPDNAADALRQAAEDAPDDVAVLSAYGRLLLRLRRADEAAVLARKLLERASSPQDWEQVRGLYALTGEREALIADLREIARRPDAPLGAMELLFGTLREAGDRDGAARALQRIVERERDRGAAYTRAVRYFMEEDDPAGALRLLADALRDRPQDALHVEAALAALAPDAPSAAALCDELRHRTDLFEETSAAQGRYLLARLALSAGRKADAAVELEHLVRQAPAMSEPYVQLAALALDEAEWDRALELVQRGIDSSGETAALLRVRGRAYEGLDRNDEAEAAWQRAIELDRNDTEALYLLGRSLDRRGEPLRARRQYQAALAVDPRLARVHEALVLNFLGQRELRLARSQVEQMRQDAGGTQAFLRTEARFSFEQEAATSRRPRRALAEDYRKSLEEIAAADPKDEQTLLHLADTNYYMLRDFDACLRQLERVQEIAPHLPERDSLYILACERLLRFEEGIARLDEMLRRHPNRLPWKLSLARFHWLVQDYDAVLRVYEPLLAGTKDATSLGQLRRVYVSACCVAGRVEKAIESVESWLAEDTPDEDLRIALIEGLMQVEENERAMQVAGDWYESAPDDPRALRARWTTLLANRHFDRALLLILDRLEDDPENPELHERLMQQFALNKEFGAAIELARNEVATADNQWIARRWEQLARVLLMAGQYDESVELFKRIARTTQDLGDALQVGSAMAEARWYDQAERYLSDMLEARRGNSRFVIEVHRRRYFTFQQAGKKRLARQEQERILELLEGAPYDPSVPGDLQELYFGVCNDLGYSLADDRLELERAERLIRDALSFAPERAAYLDSLGWVRYRRGDYAGAVLWLERAARADRPEDPVIMDHLGDARWRLGRREQAVAAWKRSQELLYQRGEDNELSTEYEQVLSALEAKLATLEEGGDPLAGEGTGETHVKEEDADEAAPEVVSPVDLKRG